MPLREWLLAKRELTRLSRGFVAAHAARAGAADLQRLLEPENADALAALIATQQPIDLLLGHRGDWTAQDLVASLRPLTPRLYSIASSRKVVGEEAHLTVAHVEYRRDDALRCSLLIPRRPIDLTRQVQSANLFSLQGWE